MNIEHIMNLSLEPVNLIINFQLSYNTYVCMPSGAHDPQDQFLIAQVA